MDIIQVLFVLVIVGVVLWLIQTYIPMAAPIKTLITIVVVLFLCIWLLQLSGLMSGYRIGPHR